VQIDKKIIPRQNWQALGITALGGDGRNRTGTVYSTAGF